MNNYKKNSTHSLLALIAVSLIVFSSCKTQKGAFGNEIFKSDSEYFRATGYAESNDITKAKALAIHRAKVEIASGISSVIEVTTSNYIEQITVGNKVEIKEKFEIASKETVDASLVNVTVRDVAYKNLKNNIIACYARVEMPTGNVLEQFSGKSSNNVKDFNPDILSREYEKAINKTK
jgi:hypothetical protein